MSGRPITWSAGRGSGTSVAVAVAVGPVGGIAAGGPLVAVGSGAGVDVGAGVAGDAGGRGAGVASIGCVGAALSVGVLTGADVGVGCDAARRSGPLHAALTRSTAIVRMAKTRSVESAQRIVRVPRG